MMKNSLWRIILILFISLQSIYATNYGLYFNSHNVPGDRRTSLLLNNNTPFELKEEITIDFQIELRDEALFGTLFHIRTDDGQDIDAVFSVHDHGLYYPALIINDNMKSMDYQVQKKEKTSIRFTLSKKENKATFTYNGKTLSCGIRLNATKNVTIILGIPLLPNRTDVVPMNIYDLKISQDKQDTFYWELKKHNDSICYDFIQQAPAVAVNPHWIINDHVEWKKIYSLKTMDKIQTAFNPKDNIFYLVSNDKMTCFSPGTDNTVTTTIKHGHRAMVYADYLQYDTLNNSLLSYNLEQRLVSRYNEKSQSWSLDKEVIDEPAYSGHSWAVCDSVAYTFGGYGFYLFRNSLFKLNLNTNEITECAYSPAITPRTSTASAVVDGKLYVFGGRGNESGKQEFASVYYYDLYAIDLKTMKSEKIWEKENTEGKFILASSMYYSPQDTAFYAACTHEYGMLIKISLNKPEWTFVSRSVNRPIAFKDGVFSFYYAPSFNKMYLLTDWVLNDYSHDITIYSIDCPLFSDNTIVQEIPEETSLPIKTILLWTTVGMILILIAARIFVKKEKSKHITGTKKETSIIEEKEQEGIAVIKRVDETVYFSREKSSISLLGGFAVKDKEGNDITFDFTPLTKQLLLMLLLYTEKDKRGILAKRLDYMIWADKNEDAARNNRNVYLRKLRALLEKVGQIEILNDKSFYSIKCGPDVFIDYNEALKQIQNMQTTNKDGEQLNKTLELLLYGPLLPNTLYEWLDDFKESYSSLSITLLTNLLSSKLETKNYDLALRIADTIFLHDPLNEEALSAKCVALCEKRMKGMALNAYEKFCKEYSESLGEEYKISFTNICSCNKERC
jgi:DNA-binding SARP family transcriptional activator